MTPKREPWERMPREHPAAWQAFSHFLEGHPLVKIAELVGKHRNSISQWRAKFAWDDRRDALEIERDLEMHRKLRTKRREVVDRHMQLLDAGEALVAQSFAQLNGKEDLATLPQATRALRHIIDAKRNMLGLPSEVVVQRQGPPIDAEELNDAAAILRDPALLAEYDRLAAKVASSGARPVAPDAGGDGGEAQPGPVAPGAAP